MGLTTLISEYILWHYGRALEDLWGIGKNFLWFGYHFFSIPLLWRTALAPFYRIKESYKGWTSMEHLLESLVANLVSRTVGFFLRMAVVVIGLLFEGAVALLLIPLFSLWLSLPLVLGGLVGIGFSLFISS